VPLEDDREQAPLLGDRGQTGSLVDLGTVSTHWHFNRWRKCWIHADKRAIFSLHTTRQPTQFIRVWSLFYLCDFFKCWIVNFLSATTMVKFGAVSRDDKTKDGSNYHHLIVTIINISYTAHWNCEFCHFWHWSWPFSTHGPRTRTNRVIADKPVYISYR
jgi:hypothetical protein